MRFYRVCTSLLPEPFISGRPPPMPG